MKSTTSNRFAQIADSKTPRSSFNRSHGHKTTLESGQLIPFYSDYAMPGDTFKMRANIFARMATPIYPIMDNVFLDVFWFDVPIRLIWENFQKFMGEQEEPNDSIDYTIPQLVPESHAVNSLADYFGMPTGVVMQDGESALFHRAYGRIYNEWFKDQNLNWKLGSPTDDGPDTCAVDVKRFPQRRGKRHDYFTSCLPWPQKGDNLVMPLGEKAPVMGIGKGTNSFPGSSTSGIYETGLTSTTTYASEWDASTDSGGFYIEEDPDNAGYPGIYADLSNATAATISAMRTSVALQQMLERDARGGTRYKEIIKSHFGVTSPDARLVRPEFLGGTSVQLNISPIAQTSSTDVTSPQGNLSAMATASVNGNGFTKSFVEHSIVMGICSIRADLTYQQGLNRQFSKRTRYDFFWPGLQNVSEMAVLNKEIYAQGTSADDDVFGYQEMYADYKYKPSIISGKMRSNAAGTLEAWHLAQDFSSLPVLGDTYIQENPPISRVVAVPTEPEFIFDSYMDLTCVRPMQLFSTPGLARF